ncbi:hypothetical protein HMPREF1002_02595 [Porphyromonas sp. 31_2]|nr:hypothetical protein HMPREF1002_02595 [Porphyromonas sp. 31_2]
MQFTTIEQMKLPIAESYFPEDSRIKVTGYKLSRLYPEDTRFVQVYNYDNDTIIDLISNNFEVCALEISNLYRYRWDLEVLFKWIKQNIVIKTLWGYSENTVKIHLWNAAISYFTVARIKIDYKSPNSITEVVTLIRISALKRTNLMSLITKKESSIILNQGIKKCSLFDTI